MLGRLLCKLGVHDNVITGQNINEYGRIGSVWGGCIRCNQVWQWDN